MSWNTLISNLLLRWNRPDIDNMKRRKEKNTLQLRGLFSFLITQHKDIRMLKKTRQSSHYKNDKKTVYMFSNIFVLYYIQLSLLKMEYRWLLYCRTEEKTKKANCSMSPAGLWHDVQRLSLPWSERKTVDWCCLKGALPYELLFFSSCLGSKASFQNTLTATAPAPHNVKIE